MRAKKSKKGPPESRIWLFIQNHYLLVAFLLRIIFVIYGEIHDRLFLVQYTDIDYHVFSDAAIYVFQGQSPYMRATYRYTPLLAFCVLPNVVLPQFGKLLFIFCDIVVAFLTFRLVSSKSDVSSATFNTLFWLFNPLTLTISTRGNAESLIALLVTLFLYLIHQKRYLWSGVFFGLAVHFKIYPILFSPAIYFHLNSLTHSENESPSRSWISLLLPRRRHFAFALGAAAAFCLLTLLFYHWYGYEFLHHTYLYHITRSDPRHNFSPYFYLQYLSYGTSIQQILSLILFVPQMFIIIAISVRLYKEVEFACFAITFIFVSFNKVVTSQYFIWYISLLPIGLSNLRRIKTDAFFLFVIWLIGQGIWLAFAYLLEFEGMNSFVLIWLAGILFQFINCFIFVKILKWQKCID